MVAQGKSCLEQIEPDQGAVIRLIPKRHPKIRNYKQDKYKYIHILLE